MTLAFLRNSLSGRGEIASASPFLVVLVVRASPLLLLEAEEE